MIDRNLQQQPATCEPQPAGKKTACALHTARRVTLCGVRMDALTMEEVVFAVEEALDQKRSLMIGVVNAAKMVNMQKDLALRDSVTTCDIVLADGAPLVWLSRLKSTPLPERVAGIDLMFQLLALADRRQFRVFLLGATQPTLEKVEAYVRRHYPQLILAGSQDGYFPESSESEIAEKIRESKADMLFVAMSSPRKETFLGQWGGVMRVPICHGVGGSFDVVAGVTRRAPRWMQRIGMEWLYRVLQEPKRLWKRYLVTNTLFLKLACRDLITRSMDREADNSALKGARNL